jgi:hypothetical protein
VRQFADHEKGPDPYDPPVRRRNVRTLLAVAAVLALAAVLPGTSRRQLQPDLRYDTHAAAVEAGTVSRGALPGFVPAGARNIHLREHRGGERFVRFDYDTARAAELTAGMRRVDDDEKEGVQVPRSGWARWFPINDRTLSGGQGGYLELYEVVAGPDRGWLALDRRTAHAYYWSAEAP